MNLKHQFQEVLTGFEKYSWDEQVIKRHAGDFETALKDLQACKKCEGVCKTDFNHACSSWFEHFKLGRPCTDECYPEKFRGYYALNKIGCAAYNLPSFKVFRCPGRAQRLEQIVQTMTSLREVYP